MKKLELDRSQMKIGYMRFASWIPKATNTQSEYVTEYELHFLGNNGCTNALQQTLNNIARLVHFTVPLERHNYTLPTVITVYAYFKVLITYCIFKRFNQCVFTNRFNSLISSQNNTHANDRIIIINYILVNIFCKSVKQLWVCQKSLFCPVSLMSQYHRFK